MKKYLTFSLLLSMTTLIYSQPQKLIVKADNGPTEFRYWASDGKQLPFYDLSPTITLNQGEVKTIHLPGDAILYKIVSERKVLTIYATANCTDTVYLHRDSLFFGGDNKPYNLYLTEAEKADKYCRDYSRSRNHPLSKVNSLAEFKAMVSSRKAEEYNLLKNKAVATGFIQQQSLFADLRYKALFLKKMISLYKSPDLTQEWIEEFKNTDFYFADETSRQSEWFREILEDYACAKSFIIEKRNPAEVGDTINTFLFNNYCNILSDNNLEYATACLLYNDIFQKEYSKDTPALYSRFITLFPNSPYSEILAPEIEKIAALYNQNPENNKIHIINYDTEPESFADMIKPFAGKVIYIDIWATTCAPCLQALAEADKAKQKISCSDDVIFLYLSVDRDRAHEKWEKIINHYNLEGYHYRVNEHTAQIIYSTFGDSRGVLSIPRYVIVAKNGKIAFTNAAPLANTPKVTEQLKTFLK